MPPTITSENTRDAKAARKQHFERTLAKWWAARPESAKKQHWERTLSKWWAAHPEKRSEFSRKQMSDPARRALQSEIGYKVFSNPETQAKCLDKRRHHPKMRAGTENHSAKKWSLRDNRGRVHQFKNLRHFIREHPHLFAPEDVQWMKHGREAHCRAMALANLHPDRVRPFGQWKGWTWYSAYERRFNDGADLLNRCPT